MPLSELRLINYLSPGLPAALFEGVAAYLQDALELPLSLRHESQFSGPPQGELDPFSLGDADAAFMCAPPFFWLRERGVPVDLLVAPIFNDPRCLGRPVYFADVVTRKNVMTFDELRGGTWAYNDACSLSGYYCLLKYLHTQGEDTTFFRELRASGSHHASLALLLTGQVNAVAIDSNVLRLSLIADPSLRDQLHVLMSWGPFPVQPLVVRSDLEASLKSCLRETLLSMRSTCLSPYLRQLGLRGFAPVSDSDYASECERLLACRTLAIS